MERFIVSGGELRPGDYVHEYGAVVASVAQSDAYLGVREIRFAGDPLTRFVHFMEWHHVVRPAAEGAGDQADAPVRTEDFEW